MKSEKIHDRIISLGFFLSSLLGWIVFTVTIEPLTNWITQGACILRNNNHLWIGLGYYVICVTLPPLLLCKWELWAQSRRRGSG